jgi:prepilin-type N-terminal cleavage/methylation domain-containing protein/prepilin-type processing-associated H-X9-DG protein
MIMATNKKAFTLIELLVVIAIIAMLMAVLVPALKRVKQQATGAACLANVKGLSTCWHTYAMDNDERLLNGDSVMSGRWKAGESYFVLFPQDEQGNAKETRSLVTRQYELNGIRKGGLFPYLDTVDIFHCPGDKSRQLFPIAAGEYPNSSWWNSYSVPGLMNGEHTSGPYAKYLVKKVNEIVNPGGKAIFMENSDPRGWVIGSWLMNDPITPAWSDPIAVWHKDRSTFGFADGHAEMHLWVDNSTIVNAEKAENGLTYTRPQAGESGDDIRFAQQIYVPRRR